MEKTDYEFFKKECKLQGKHARMADELWKLNDVEHSYFKRLIDLYMVAPIIGFRMNHKAALDTSGGDEKSIFAETVIKEKENLEFIMQMILMLESAEQDGDKEAAIKKAFKGAESKEQFDAYNKLFNDYVRGGVEELYQRLVVQTRDIDDEFSDERTTNIVELIRRFETKNS